MTRKWQPRKDGNEEGGRDGKQGGNGDDEEAVTGQP